MSSSPRRVALTAATVGDLHLQGRRATAFARLLSRSGFRGWAQEHLAGPNGQQGYSLVAAFARASGPAAVRDDLIAGAYTDNHVGHIRLTRFRVPGMPSARGLTALDGTIATANVYWTEGRCVFGSGLYLPTAARRTAAAVDAPVIAGIRSQRARTHGRCS